MKRSNSLIEKIHELSCTKSVLQIYSHDDLIDQNHRDSLRIQKLKSYNFNILQTKDRFEILSELDRKICILKRLKRPTSLTLILSSLVDKGSY